MFVNPAIHVSVHATMGRYHLLVRMFRASSGRPLSCGQRRRIAVGAGVALVIAAARLWAFFQLRHRSRQAAVELSTRMEPCLRTLDDARSARFSAKQFY